MSFPELVKVDKELLDTKALSGSVSLDAGLDVLVDLKLLLLRQHLIFVNTNKFKTDNCQTI
jgi:hypothetical protein